MMWDVVPRPSANGGCLLQASRSPSEHYSTATLKSFSLPLLDTPTEPLTAPSTGPYAAKAAATGCFGVDPRRLLGCCGVENAVHPQLDTKLAPPDAIKPTKTIALVPSQASSKAQKSGGGARKLTILHFNDVYNIEPGKREPVGGAARFCHKVKSMQNQNPLIVFSGDAFNPSLLSTVTLGAQMPPVLNEIGCHVACMGNHDFDFGTSNLMKLVKQCNFPLWLVANVLDAKTKKPYAHAHATHTMMWNGIKVGFAGLVEEEWLETLGAVNLNDLEYVDFVEEGHRLIRKLKEEGCELLVAITHMRVPNDQLLARECTDFHLVLGGHDHHYVTEVIGKVNLVKSGTDFREMTKIDIVMPEGSGRPTVALTKIDIDGSIPEDPKVKEIVDSYMGEMEEHMKEVIGHSACDLDGRFLTVRTRESNLGNLVCDIIKTATGADCVMINGGTFRSDVIHPMGDITLGDLMSVLPMMDPAVVLEATGAQIIIGLENSVSMYPKLEGRFAQVSGISFAFDPNAAPRSRIMHETVMIAGEPVDLTRKYMLATHTYVAEGKDGYDVFKGCRVLVDEDAGVLLATAARNHFRMLDVLNLWDPKVKVMKFARHWSKNVIAARSTNSLTSLAAAQSSSAIDLLAEAEAAVGGKGGEAPREMREEEEELYLPARSAILPDAGTCVIQDKYSIKPIVDGRIVVL